MEASEQRRIIEALILAAPEPLSLQRLVAIVPGINPALAKDRIQELNAEYEANNHAFEIWEVAGGFQIRTRAEFSGYLQQLRKDRPLRLSQAALECLAIVAYKQPLTRAELELVRGVDSGAVLRSLLDRRLLRLLGHRDVPGRPLIYGTGKRFLEVFGLESLKQLPSLRELEDLAREQGVELASNEPADPGQSEDPSSADPESDPDSRSPSLEAVLADDPGRQEVGDPGDGEEIGPDELESLEGIASDDGRREAIGRTASGLAGRAAAPRAVPE